MSTADDLEKLCDLSKLEIPGELMIETSIKIREVLKLFDILDEFDKKDQQTISDIDIKIEKPINSLRDDQLSEVNTVKGDLQTKIKFSNSKNGYILGPRI